MSEKKVVVFIVEGPSDEAALGTIMKKYFSSNEVQFIVVQGDITLKDYVSSDNILKKMVLVNKCVGNIYSTIYRCWYPQIFINIGIQVIA